LHGERKSYNVQTSKLADDDKLAHAHFGVLASRLLLTAVLGHLPRVATVATTIANTTSATATTNCDHCCRRHHHG
jgi:hypothetical protein